MPKNHETTDQSTAEPVRALTVAYLAGPMTGYPDFNREGFAAAEQAVLAHGWQVRSPQNTDPGHDGPCPDGARQSTPAGSHPYPCWVRASLRMMLDCHIVVLLSGWQNSRGALLEKQVADTCGMPVLELAQLSDHQQSARRSAGPGGQPHPPRQTAADDGRNP